MTHCRLVMLVTVLGTDPDSELLASDNVLCKQSKVTFVHRQSNAKHHGSTPPTIQRFGTATRSYMIN